MRWVAIILVALALMVGAFWWVFVRAPTPEEVCAHKIALTRAEVTDQNAEPYIEQLERTCAENAQRRIEMRGKLKYAHYARCVVGADSLEKAERCSSK